MGFVDDCQTANERFGSKLDCDRVGIIDRQVRSEKRYTEAEALRVGNLLIQGAAELRRRRMEGKNDD